jgi:type I restriction enzyme R subunit
VFSEDALVKKPAITLLQSLGWGYLNCYEETFGLGGTLGRETFSEVLLVSCLRPALEKLYPGIAFQALGLPSWNLPVTTAC